MSRDTALVKARGLKAVLLDHGVPEVSIELQQGRPTSGDRWDALRVVANFAHHTVSRYDPRNLTPVLGLVKSGRVDVRGPLANGYGAFDLCYRILCMGLANHPGKGGPLAINGYTIPEDSARPYTWGTEWEGGLDTADWDRELRNPRNGRRMTMRECMGRAHAGIQDYFGLPRTAHLEHKTWAPTRKIDRLGYTRDSGIAEIDRYDTAPVEDDMTPEQDARLKTVEKRLDAVVERLDNLGRTVANAPVYAIGADGKTDTTVPLQRRLWILQSELRALAATTSPAKLADAISAKLPAGGPTKELLVEALTEVIFGKKP